MNDEVIKYNEKLYSDIKHFLSGSFTFLYAENIICTMPDSNYFFEILK